MCVCVKNNDLVMGDCTQKLSAPPGGDFMKRDLPLCPASQPHSRGKDGSESDENRSVGTQRAMSVTSSQAPLTEDIDTADDKRSVLLRALFCKVSGLMRTVIFCDILYVYLYACSVYFCLFACCVFMGLAA